MTRRARRGLLIAVLAIAALLVPVGVAPDAHAAGHMVSAGSPSEKLTTIVVHSDAMDRDIPLTVIKPRDPSQPRGVLYLLNGAGGGEDSASWLARTDIESFFADKNVYVVIPEQGAFSYYTDWIRRDPTLGVNKWSTFLGSELPAVIDSTYRTSGRNAIGGISSSGTSVLNLAIAHRGLYRAAASYSGCASTSDPLGQQYIKLVVDGRGGGNTVNMWGPDNGPLWRANDPVLNAGKLRGTALYISNSSGLPGPHDNPQAVRDPITLTDQVVLGGGIEAATSICTQQLLGRLNGLRIPYTADVGRPGTHSWGYWQDQLHRSWPFFRRAIGG
ncbi:alpha/beta hydrolase family protein [Gordonia sp. N1V]|uniref:alpha/beta hydrolase n=1 Tax=Gordonia sp. N1V TaxID=3034163 RepID=UPI0023E2E18C|nr:alpha/beta hydrolase family protein [Gordonia sp. N1V]MDF3280716.1 alpha/beta hydrolase family protein [Gordonia sp. N1V]